MDAILMMMSFMAGMAGGCFGVIAYLNRLETRFKTLEEVTDRQGNVIDIILNKIK